MSAKALAGTCINVLRWLWLLIRSDKETWAQTEQTLELRKRIFATKSGFPSSLAVVKQHSASLIRQHYAHAAYSSSHWKLANHFCNEAPARWRDMPLGVINCSVGLPTRTSCHGKLVHYMSVMCY